MTYEPQVCHVDTRAQVGNIRLSGYSISEDCDRLDLFVTVYRDSDALEQVPDAETRQAAEFCFRFLKQSAEGKLAKSLDQSTDAYGLAKQIERGYGDFEELRIYVLTDGQVKTKNFKPQQVGGKTVRLEVMDIERLHRHLSEGKPRDELVVNFEEVAGTPLPCVYIPGEDDSYDYAMTVFPAEVLRHLYDKYGARLLEANVRSFLSATGKVNKGIQATLRSEPEKFVAYNNGIVVVADEASVGRTKEGGPGLSWLKGMQIVNGGQTTASIFFTKKKFPEVDLSRIQVPAKVVILKTENSVAEEALISDISRYANSQNTVRQSDLSANAPFHVGLEKLSGTVYLPDGVGRWFYERAAGSYNTMLAREGSTASKYRNLRTNVVPPSRRLVKTDLAKFLMAWEGHPDLASLGGQKNFARFMDRVKVREERGEEVVPTLAEFKAMIAKVITFKQSHSIIRSLLPAFQGNVTIYLIALLAAQFGDTLNLARIWDNQGISDELKSQIRVWAKEVNAALTSSAGGRMLSEWAKKAECWEDLRTLRLSAASTRIPELRR